MRRKTKKRLVAAGITFTIFAGLGVGAFFFVKDIKKDKEATREQMKVVQEGYNEFSNNIDTFNDLRNELYEELFDNTYYDTLFSKDEEFKTKLKEYENSVDSISTSVKELEKLCNGIYYPDGSVNAKCSEYDEVYEQVVNAFVSDINLYNTNIDSYNEYANENKLETTLESYPTTKKYIDYNKDKKYDGKEE